MLLVLFHFNIEIKIMNIKQFKINWQNCFKMNKIINFGLQIFLMFSYSISNDYNQYRYSKNIYSWRGLFSIKKRSVVQHEYISINHILHRFILQHVLKIKSVFWWFDFYDSLLCLLTMHLKLASISLVPSSSHSWTFFHSTWLYPTTYNYIGHKYFVSV